MKVYNTSYTNDKICKKSAMQSVNSQKKVVSSAGGGVSIFCLAFTQALVARIATYTLHLFFM